MVITDGVFSMDGETVKLAEIVALAEKYNAMVFVDDSHATGFMGKTGLERTSTAACSARSM